jgi:murein DD-endopeptidase MepM/ murein hydrolase activator NlpD
MALPLSFVPKDGWHAPPRSFGAPRSRGKRKHAGCDLYAPVGTKVHACEDGVILAHKPFYLGTYATVIQHDGFVIRYGEVQKGLGGTLKVGDKVKKGDLIGTVGKLSGLSISMVHFEMFTGKGASGLTNTKAPFFRRADLIDPTGILDQWAKETLPV